MKSTGIVRKVDQLGRIVIPKELRRTLNLVENKDSLEIYIEKNTILLKKFVGGDEKSSMTRGIDPLGRIVLPIELRRRLDIAEERDSLEIYIDHTTIILKKYEPACVFCQNARNVFTFKGKNICPACLEELKAIN